MSHDRILVVDDEREFVTFLVKCLERMGYVISDIASTGEAAIAAARHGKPDIVLMDIFLKGPMDGIEAATRIRSQLNIPVIFLTGTDADKTIERAKTSEPLGYLLKPFKARELKTTIDTALYTFRAMLAREKEAGRVAAGRYQDLFDNAIEGMLQVSPAGTILRINRSAARILGFKTPEEILKSGINLRDLLCLTPGNEKFLSDKLKERGSVEGYELEVFRRDGRTVALSMNLRMTPGDQNSSPFMEIDVIEVGARKPAAE